MPAKTDMILRLGEQGLLLPALLGEALAANDRLKLRLTLLQAAARYARFPDPAPQRFDQERRTAGLDDADFDKTIAGARMVGADRVLAPGARLLIAGTAKDLGTMLAPLAAAGAPGHPAFAERTAALIGRLPGAMDDTLALDDIAALAAARSDGADTVHLLVMDLHKAINELVAETAIETLEGASVHHLDGWDRQRVLSFMRGLHRTAALAFGHPGLGTTAAHVGSHLIIQNDIGTTDAHVIVIHVEPGIATVTYTDIHHRRARFFMALFEGQGAQWTPLAERSNLGDGADLFYLVTGRFSAATDDELDRFLAFLGSRIVFLIDWNKARKALQTFVDPDAAVAILKWAAEHDHGHRAFLELGGLGLVYDTIRRVAAGRIPYGARLDETLGAAESAGFLRVVLRQTSEGLRAGRSIRLIRDEIQADLSQRFDSIEFGVLTIVLRHLGIGRMLAAMIADAFAQDEGVRQTLADRAKLLEQKADRLTLEAREMCARMQGAEKLRLFADEIEDATDALDESAFLFGLLPAGVESSVLGGSAELAEIVIDSIGDLVRATEAIARLPEGNRLDATEALQAIDGVVLAEQRADTAERNVFAAFMRVPDADARVMILGTEIARALETATDHLAHAALALRERALEELSK